VRDVGDWVLGDYILVFDTETTGLPRGNDHRSIGQEILQVGMIDGNGDILFNELIKPVQRKRWTAAERVNGISYEMVKEKNTFEYWREEIQCHIDKAGLLVAFNFGFDCLFLRSAGIIFGGKQYFDVMEIFARQHGVKDGLGRRLSSLQKCAEFYNYRTIRAHDAVEDAKATLYCYRKLMEEIESTHCKSQIAGWRTL
jgi:DNA polymerase-3 subunit epsilon